MHSKQYGALIKTNILDKHNVCGICRNNQGGILCYKKCSGKRLQQTKTNSQASEWRVCVRSEEEKKRILKSCHGGAAGSQFGKDKTQSNVSNVTHGITIGV